MGGGGGGTGPDTPLHGTRSRANTQVRPYAGRGAFRNQRRAVRNKAHGAGRSPPPTGERRRSRRGVVTPPYGCITGGAQQRADVPKAWLPPAKFRSEIWGVSHGHRPLRPAGGREGGTPGSSCPTGGCGEPPALASGAERSVCGADGRNGWESRQRSPQKCPATPDNPSVSLWPTAPFAQGSLALRGTGDADCRVAALLAMTTVFCHSEASAHTGRGNPSFLRWTGVRAAVPRAWPPPTKFRAEIWGVGQVVGPYGCSAGGAQQRRVGRVSGISWTPPPPARRSGCCRGSRRGP